MRCEREIDLKKRGKEGCSYFVAYLEGLGCFQSCYLDDSVSAQDYRRVPCCKRHIYAVEVFLELQIRHQRPFNDEEAHRRVGAAWILSSTNHVCGAS